MHSQAHQVFTIRECNLTRPVPNTGEVATTSSITLLLSRQTFRRPIGRPTTDRSRATYATNIWSYLRTLNIRARFSMHPLQPFRLHPIHSLTRTALSSVQPVSVCQSRIRGIRLRFRTRPGYRPLDKQSRSLPGFGFAASTTPVPGMKSSLTGIRCSTWGYVVRWESLAITSRRGTGNLVSVTRVTRARMCSPACTAGPHCEMR